jgi:signal transduction histidine kinase
MRRIRYMLWPAGIVIGLAAESAEFGFRGGWLADLLVGWTFIACGLIAWGRRPESRTGALTAATGFAWFLPNFAAGDGLLSLAAANTLFWHRGPLIHLVLTYPEGRASSSLVRSAVAVGYAAALLYPVSHNDVATIALAGFVLVVSVLRYARSVGPARRAHRVAMWATIAVSLLLGGEATIRLAAPGVAPNNDLLLAYEVTLCAIAVGLTVGLLVAPWRAAAVTDLVVELGEARSGTLRDELANALGDQSLEVGYWLPEQRRFVDAEGHPVDLPDPASERSITTVEREGRPVAALVHDPAVLADPGLIDAVSAAAKLAASNARLQADVRARQAEIRVSRQRILEAGDEERRRLERHLHMGAERRLEELGQTLADARASTNGPAADRITHAEERLAATRDELRRLARGLHPRELAEQGLAGALASLVADAPLPAELVVPEGPIPPTVAACAYFVCSEALANATKHARASSARVSVRRSGDDLRVSVEDDGIGGADPGGSGLRGLADRVETLGGRLRVESPSASGTCVTAVIPLGDAAR